MRWFRPLYLPGLCIWMYLLTGCMAQDAREPRIQSVTVYTDCFVPGDSLIYRKFEKELKIKVYIRTLPSDRILSVIRKEHFNSRADLIILHGADRLASAARKKLFRPADSEALHNVIRPNYRSPYNTWFTLSKSPIVFAYDDRVLSHDTLSFYLDILKPAWTGKLALQSPDASTLKVLHKSMRFLNPEKQDSFLLKLYRQAVLPKTGDDLLQLKRIYQGQAQLAITELSSVIESYSGRDSVNRPLYRHIQPIFPGQRQKGFFYNITGAGIYRYARNPENARLLLEFLASKRAQYAFAANRSEFPVMDGVPASTLLQKYQKFRGRFFLNRFYNSSSTKETNR